MIRRAPLAVLAAAVAVALSGCSTFTDNDVVAQVGDEQLTESDIRSIVGDDEATDVPYAAANTIITNWILDQVLRFDLAQGGNAIEQEAGEPTAESQEASFGAAFTAWQAAEPRTITNDKIASAYGAGPTESGMVCVAHILVDSEDTADEVIDLFADGEATFTELAAEYSTDPGSAGNGGILPCSSLSAFASAYVPEFAEAVIDTAPDEVVGPVESQFGFHVIWVRPFDDLTQLDIDALLADALVRFSFAADEAGVDVDPRFGEFSVATGLSPVG